MNPDEQFYSSSDTRIDFGTEMSAGVDPGFRWACPNRGQQLTSYQHL